MSNKRDIGRVIPRQSRLHRREHVGRRPTEPQTHNQTLLASADELRKFLPRMCFLKTAVHLDRRVDSGEERCVEAASDQVGVGQERRAVNGKMFSGR